RARRRPGRTARAFFRALDSERALGEGVADLGEQFEGGGHDLAGFDAPEAGMVAFGTHAAEAVPAWHVVHNNAIRYTPGRVLRVGERVDIDDRRAYGGREMHRPGVVRKEQRRAGEHSRKRRDVEPASERDGRGARFARDA